MPRYRHLCFAPLFLVLAFCIKAVSAPYTFSTESNAFALAAPQLQAKPSLVGAITLSWNSVAGATGYVLERSGSGEAGSFMPLQTLGASARTFRHTGLYYNQKVYYRIKAISGSDASPFSAVASATTHKQGQIYNIMPLGDSNTEGGSSSVPVAQKAAYRARLEQLLNGSASKGRYDYVGSEQGGSAYVTDTDHAGFGGARNSDLVQLLQKGSYSRWYDNQHMGLNYTANYLEVYNPDIILLHSGTNEISNDGVDNSQQTVEELEEILKEIDDYEKSAGKEVTVILATLIKSVCTDQFCYRGAQYSKNDIIDFYNAKIEKLASKRVGNGDRLILVDMADAGIVYDFTDRGGDMADPLHPALVGYNKMAPVWFKELDKLLSVQPQQPDTQAPETTIASKPAAISNKSTAAFSFTSNESNVQFQVSMDEAAFVTAATPYTHSSLADGEHTLQVRAIDQAGNIDPTPAAYTWTIDTKAPAPPVVSAPAEGAIFNSNKPTISGTAEAGSAVAVYIGAKQVGAATTGADGKWSLVPSTELGEGRQELTAKATDAAGNSSTASNVRNFTVDTQSPETTIAAAPDPVTNSPEATFRFSSNKSEVSYQVSLDGAAYRQVQSPYTVNGLAEGKHTLAVRATDAAGNTDPTPATYTWIVDTQAPDAPAFTAVSEDRGPVSDDQITSDNTLRLTGKAEAGAAVTISINGAVAGKTTSSSAGNWSFSHEQTALPAGEHSFTAIATDAAGNASKASAAFRVTVDLTAPTVALSTTANGPQNKAFTLTIKFSEEIFGLAVADFEVKNATLNNLQESGPTMYTATVTPTADGQVFVSLPAARVTDLAGNANEVSNQLKLDYDATKPKLALSTEAPAIVNEPFSVTFTFDEPVSGFELADITVTNGTAANLSTTGQSVYTATIQPDKDGQVGVSVAANKAFDAAGNGNTASGTVTRVYDVEPPTVVVSTAAPNPSNAPFRVQVTFSEDVEGFVADDVRVTNGSSSSLKKESGSSYTVLVTPAASGVVAVSVAADMARDMAANGNKASNELSLDYDADRPAVVVSTEASSPINTSFTVSFTLSEAVSGFELADLALGNASASDFRKTADNVYTATIQPATDGKVSISIPANSMQDAATNGNEASNKLELVYDGTAPAGYAVQFVPELVDIDNQAQVSLTISGAEAGAKYHYSIKSSNGGTDVEGTGEVSASAFTIPDLNLTALHDGMLTVSLYLIDNAGNKGPDAMDQVQKLTKNIAEVDQPEPITVPFKTEFGAVPLPAEVAVTYTNGESDNLKVKWDAGDYNGTIPGSYMIIGELELKESTSNTNNIVARATVVVEPNKAPTDLQLSSNTFRPDISPNELIGNFTTTDPDDDTHTYALVNGQGDESNGLFEIVNNELYLVSNRGLSGKSTFSVRVRSTDPYQNTIEKNFTLTKTLYQPEGGLELINAFSPNNDGINDLWVVPELRYYDNIQVEVFDRAGVRLFTTNDPEKGWDGRGKDGRVLQGSYFYIIRIKDIDLVQKGVVTVLK